MILLAYAVLLTGIWTLPSANFALVAIFGAVFGAFLLRLFCEDADKRYMWTVFTILGCVGAICLHG